MGLSGLGPDTFGQFWIFPSKTNLKLPSPNLSLYILPIYIPYYTLAPFHNTVTFHGGHSTFHSPHFAVSHLSFCQIGKKSSLNNKRILRPGGTYGKPVFRLMTKTVTVAPPVKSSLSRNKSIRCPVYKSKPCDYKSTHRL